MKIAAGGAIFFLAIVAGLLWMLRMDQQSGEELIAVHLTSPGTEVVREIKTPRKERYGLLMYEGDSWDELIIKGRVSEILGVGGGITQVCLERPDDRLDCGLADSSLGLKVGDTTFLRTGELRRWSVGDFSRYYESSGWIITRTEAEALVKTGEFKFE